MIAPLPNAVVLPLTVVVVDGGVCPRQPLWLGGTQGEKSLTYIHTYPEVEGAQPLMEEEGLFFAGDMESASRVVTDGPGSGFNFRFFVQVRVGTLLIGYERCCNWLERSLLVLLELFVYFTVCFERPKNSFCFEALYVGVIG